MKSSRQLLFRFNQTLQNFVNGSVGNDVYQITKNDLGIETNNRYNDYQKS